MDIKLFSLCNQDSPEAVNGKEQILGCVNDFFPSGVKFNDFTSQKRLLVAISQSLLAADIVLVAVQSTMFNATKRLLCSALDIKTERNEEIASALSAKMKTRKLKPNFFEASVTFPQNAVVMPTSDYLNCGFALTSGGQHIIYMPVEDNKAQQIILGSLYDYFAEISEALVASQALKHRHRLLIANAVKKLGSDSIRVSVAGNDASDYLVSFLKKSDSSAFTVDMDYDSPEDETDEKTISIHIARNVRDRNHTDLGVYISNPFLSEEDGNALCSYVAIANEEGTKTYKIIADADEGAKELLRVCVDKLLLVLCDYESIECSVEESEENKAADKKLRDMIGIAASAAVLAASVAGFILALVLR